MTFQKIIWQTHNYKKESLPINFFYIGNTWKNLNPDWDYRYVDQFEREEIVKKYPAIYKFYKTLSPVRQSDIWRILITYEYGGCYADMDSVCNMPLDYLIDSIGGDPEIITVPIKNGKGNNCNYIVKAKSPIMNLVINDKPFVPYNSFVDIVYSHSNVSKLFTASLHGGMFKDITYSPVSLEIDYYGTKMKYVDFLKQNSLKM